MAALTIVRHGDTFRPGEPPRRIGARTDLPLAPSGRAQASAVGRAFAEDNVSFARVLCSPLRRTRETAALILAERDGGPLPIEPCAWLTEIDHGADENAHEADVVARIGADALAAWDERGVPPSDWAVDAAARIAAWRAFFDEQRSADARDTLLVTSNGAARFALLADPALADAARAACALKLRTGAWGRIVVDCGGVRLEGWNIRP